MLYMLIGIPLVGALLCLLIPNEEKSIQRFLGGFFSILTFAFSLALWLFLDSSKEGLNTPFGDVGSKTHFAIDNLSLCLVVLTTFLTVIVFLASSSIQERVKGYVVCVLLLESAMLGAFLALDVFVFYVFWELMLIPMYFIIGMFGGHRRIYATMKFVLYTMVGSLVMLVAMLYLGNKIHEQLGHWSFAYGDFMSLKLSLKEQLLCFAAFALAFGIKVPLFPFHTWLPDAHVEAPTTGSVILAGVLLKFGAYGFLRFAIPFFPLAFAKAAPVLVLLALIGILYGSLLAYAQTDIKKLVAYSSVAHMGTVILGIAFFNVASVTGAIFQMLAHGISTGGLFLCIGVLYERRHTRELSDFGGIMQKMPLFGAIFLVFVMASIGLPGLCGFIGEFLTLIGLFAPNRFGSSLEELTPMGPLVAFLAALSVILGAVYMLSMTQKVLFGPISRKENEGLKDVTLKEAAYLVPMLLLAVVLGVFPRLVLNKISSVADSIVSKSTVLRKPPLLQPQPTTPAVRP